MNRPQRLNSLDRGDGACGLERPEPVVPAEAFAILEVDAEAVHALRRPAHNIKHSEIHFQKREQYKHKQNHRCTFMHKLQEHFAQAKGGAGAQVRSSGRGLVRAHVISSSVSGALGAVDTPTDSISCTAIPPSAVCACCAW